MSTLNSDIEKLNQIVLIIDNKANIYKSERHHMAGARADAEKKLILDLIKDGLDLAARVGPQARGLMDDLKRLQQQFVKF